MLLPVNDWLYFECFRFDYIAIHNAGLLLRRHLSFRMLIVRRACRHDITRASMLLCNKCFLIGCRSDAIVDTLFVVCRAVYFCNFRYFEANRHSYQRLLMQSYRIFWILLDSGWFWFAIFGAFARICTATYANLYKMCSSKICPNAFVSERSFGVFATFVLFCINP